MLIFLALVLGPGCSFMLYALYQFSREALRFRHPVSRGLGGVVTVVAATNALDEPNPPQAAETPKVLVVSKKEAPPAKFTIAGNEPALAKVVTTYLKNRLAVIPSGTGRLAVRRVAKRSS